MEWISIADKLPKDGTYCWICDIDKTVLDGYFLERCPIYENQDINLKYTKGFCLDEETGVYIYLDKLLFWMPYFTPPPPK
jgi:hypothetical protein